SDGAVLADTPSIELDLAAGEVLQVVGGGTLSGTEIESDRPVLVIAGHDCTNVPNTSRPCDHLEEIVPPLASWGRTVVAAAPRSVPDEPSVLRIFSAEDDNTIRIASVSVPIV